MSPIDLILLGLLKKQPRSAYELNRYAESIRISRWARLRSSTTYLNVKKLAAAGYLSATAVRDGEMPEKTVYTVTQVGEEYFIQLMRHFAANPGDLAFDFNAVTGNLDLVGADVATELLLTLRDWLCRTQADLAADVEALRQVPRGGRAIMRLYQMLLATVGQWADEEIQAQSGTSAPAATQRGPERDPRAGQAD